MSSWAVEMRGPRRGRPNPLRSSAKRLAHRRGPSLRQRKTRICAQTHIPSLVKKFGSSPHGKRQGFPGLSASLHTDRKRIDGSASSPGAVLASGRSSTRARMLIVQLFQALKNSSPFRSTRPFGLHNLEASQAAFRCRSLPAYSLERVFLRNRSTGLASALQDPKSAVTEVKVRRGAMRPRGRVIVRRIWIGRMCSGFGSVWK